MREKFVCPRRIVRDLQEDEWRDGATRWTGKSGFEVWPDGFMKPHTCSYCGGIHPDDAIELLIDGWEFEQTEKPWKFYMHPPGGEAYPVPAVKVYLMHWTREQVARVQDVVRTRRVFIEAASMTLSKE